MDRPKHSRSRPGSESPKSNRHHWRCGPDDVRTLAEHEPDRPRTRRDCLDGGVNSARPCPWVRCRSHLAIDVHPQSGSIKPNHPLDDFDAMPATCALDVVAAHPDGVTLETVAGLLNVTRERVRQIEERALARLAARTPGDVLENPEPVPTHPVASGIQIRQHGR